MTITVADVLLVESRVSVRFESLEQVHVVVGDSQIVPMGRCRFNGGEGAYLGRRADGRHAVVYRDADGDTVLASPTTEQMEGWGVGL